MKIPVTVFITTRDDGSVELAQADSQGVAYSPTVTTKVNGIHKFVFDIEGDVDKTPSLSAWVVDSVQAQTRLG